LWLALYGKPEQVDILTLGGSTTDQRYIDDSATWQQVLEARLNAAGYPLKIANAGVDGQSTFGHLESMDRWLSHVPGLAPRYIWFYVGINDFYKLNPNGYRDYFSATRLEKWKNQSALYNLGRTLKGMILAKGRGVAHRSIDFSDLGWTSQRRIPASDIDAVLGELPQAYHDRLLLLAEKARAMGAEPVFVTQPSSMYRFLPHGHMEGINTEGGPVGGRTINGLDYYYLLSRMNTEVHRVGEELGVTVLDLTPLTHWETADFYDYIHTTEQGAAKVGHAMADQWLSLKGTSKVD
ncbi:MAG: GDSL-type esterase/lipase family protein, partial [Bacteroidota bacterium]